MMTRFVIESALVIAVIIGFCFEERIARAERRLFQKLVHGKQAKLQRRERANRMLREARYIRAQRQRELELLELGLDPRPSLKVVKAPCAPLADKQEEVA